MQDRRRLRWSGWRPVTGPVSAISTCRESARRVRAGHHGVMTISGAGKTAKMTAAGRALESRRPDRLFDDPLAQALAGEEGFRWMQQMRPPGAPAENPSIGPRTWFFDQLITRAAGDRLHQVVLLAAGMDTRAFRLPLPAGTIVYELDDPAVLAGKQAILDGERAVPCCRRRPGRGGPRRWPPPDSTLPPQRSWWPKDSPCTCPPMPWPCYWTRQQASRRPEAGSASAWPARTTWPTRPSPRTPSWPRPAAPAGSSAPTTRAASSAAHGWQADIHDVFAVARSLGPWPPPGVPGDVADRAAAASRNWLISATRIPSAPRAYVG